MTAPACVNARQALPDSLRGRLSAAAERELGAHLASCAECRALAERERGLDAALGRLPPRAASESLKQRLAASVAHGHHDVSAQTAARASVRALGLRNRVILGVAAAACVLGVFVGLAWLRAARGGDLLVNEAVNDHLRVLYAEHSVEIENGGIHQVKPWFEGRLDFAPTLDFAGDDEFTLVGGSVAYFVDRKAAVFVFKRRLHVMTLFVFRAEGLPWPYASNVSLGRLSAELAHSRGFGTLIFRDGDLGYALVSDVEDATLLRFGNKLTHRP